jgi:hypothetical protein
VRSSTPSPSASSRNSDENLPPWDFQSASRRRPQRAVADHAQPRDGILDIEKCFREPAAEEEPHPHLHQGGRAREIVGDGGDVLGVEILSVDADVESHGVAAHDDGEVIEHEIVEHAEIGAGISDEAREVAAFHVLEDPAGHHVHAVPCRHLNSAPVGGPAPGHIRVRGKGRSHRAVSDL